ncbi:MAG TPA: DUF4019 domain-containing protein, partial [Pyrinomonadaceae bacterium]
CTLKASRGGVPTAAQAAVDAVTEEMRAGNFQQIYDEAADEWKRKTTPEQSRAFFQTLKTKLGNVKSRSYHSATERTGAGGAANGRAFIITYSTTFERAEGMETFTLLERGDRWLLAGYIVNSDALK